MKIPKSFMLHAQKIGVVYDKMLAHESDNVGQARLRDNKIVLQPEVEGHKRIRSRVEQSF